MNFKNLFPVLSIMLLLFACSKSSNTGTTPQDPVLASYQSGNALQIQQLAIYTRNGIVSNPSVVQQFLNNHVTDAEAKRKFYVNQSAVTNHGITVNIDFLERNRVRMNGRLMEITQSTDSLLTISAYDSTDVPFLDLSPCGLIKDLVPQITPKDNCGMANCLKYRQTYPLIFYGNNYYLPVLYYGGSTWYNELVNGFDVWTNCASVSQPDFNLAKDNILPSLAEHDTLIIQTALLPLTRTSK